MCSILHIRVYEIHIIFRNNRTGLQRRYISGNSKKKKKRVKSKQKQKHVIHVAIRIVYNYY